MNPVLDHGLIKWKGNIENISENANGKKTRVVKSKNQTREYKGVHCHAQGCGLLFFESLRNKQKKT